MTQEKQNSAGWATKIPAPIWTPIAAGILTLIVGVVGMAAHQPWLIPSLGPTAFLQAQEPKHPSSKIYNTFIGHLYGFGAGLLAATLLGANSAPPVLSTGELPPVRVWASVVGMTLNLLVASLLKAPHPPAAATTLLVTVGSLKPIWKDAITVIMGALIIGVAGEVLRQLRIGKAKSLVNG